jgi:hypothetical protein
MSDFNENEDLSESLAATLTGSEGLQEDGSGDMSDSLANDLADQEQHLAEKDIPVSNDVQDTAQAELDREAEQDQARGRKQKVPLAALHEERQKRQALEVQLAAQQQQMQQFMAQQQAAQQAQLQAQQEAEIPSFEDDPHGYILAREKQFAQELENLKNGQGQQQQVQLAQQQFAQEVAVLTPVVIDSEARFKATHPDYDAAASHVFSTVGQAIRQQHPYATPEQLQHVQTAALVQFAKICQAQGIDPAEHLYGRAQQLGFQTARQAPRREYTSLSNAAGSTRAPDEKSGVSASQISQMSDREFDDFFNSMKSGAAVKPAY